MLTNVQNKPWFSHRRNNTNSTSHNDIVEDKCRENYNNHPSTTSVSSHRSAVTKASSPWSSRELSFTSLLSSEKATPAPKWYENQGGGGALPAPPFRIDRINLKVSPPFWTPPPPPPRFQAPPPPPACLFSSFRSPDLKSIWMRCCLPGAVGALAAEGNLDALPVLLL